MTEVTINPKPKRRGLRFNLSKIIGSISNEILSFDHRKTPSQELYAKVGQTWDTQELQQEFEVLGFMAPYVVTKSLKTNEMGSLQFQHDPRFWARPVVC